uniref:Uncharacterized protein n=1 Tax=Arundo donax TaxID=35708 RepID=A0A0A9H7J3_ARUDO
MARGGAAVVLTFAVCCLLVAPAPARRPAELPARVLDAVDREAAAEPLRPKPVAVADAEDAEQGAELAVPEEGTVLAVREEGPRQRSSLLCLFFRSGGEPADAGSALVARGSSEEPAALDGSARPAVAGKAEVEDEEVGDVEDDGEEPPYDSDSDSDCDSDSDDEDEGGVLGWFWRLARRF